MSSSGEDASGSDTDDTDDEDEEAAEERRRKEEEEEWGVGVMAANPEEPIPLIDETNRWVAQVLCLVFLFVLGWSLPLHWCLPCPPDHGNTHTFLPVTGLRSSTLTGTT